MYKIEEKHCKKWRTLQWERMPGITADNSIRERNVLFSCRRQAKFYAKIHQEITGKKTKTVKV